jgi:hypothetical protein
LGMYACNPLVKPNIVLSLIIYWSLLQLSIAVSTHTHGTHGSCGPRFSLHSHLWQSSKQAIVY